MTGSWRDSNGANGFGFQVDHPTIHALYDIISAKVLAAILVHNGVADAIDRDVLGPVQGGLDVGSSLLLLVQDAHFARFELDELMIEPERAPDASKVQHRGAGNLVAPWWHRS